MESLFSELLYDSDFHNKDIASSSWKESFNTFQRTYTKLWFFGLATPWMKYHSAALFSRVARQELPPPPVDTDNNSLYRVAGAFLGGIGYVFLQTMIRNESRKGAWSVLMCKKGLPPVHPFELDDATCGLYKTLTKKPTGRERKAVGDLWKYVTPTVVQALPEPIIMDILADQVDRTCQELFRGKTLDASYVPRIPAYSSHFESSRKAGGGFGNILGLLANTYPTARKSDAFGKCKLTSHCSCSRCVDDLFVQPFHEYSQFEQIEEYQETHNFSRVFDALFSENDREDLINSPADPQRNRVAPIALPEPLKVRMITRGPVLRYWLGSVVQKFTHRTLRNHPTFRAIGRPLDTTDVESLGLLQDDEGFLSGDYKSATDLIHPQLSMRAATSIADTCNFPAVFKKVFVEGLVGAELQVTLDGASDSQGTLLTKGSYVKQTWGQLMGSPLSFPILCIINAAVNRWFLELCSREEGGKGEIMLLSRTPMLINGDDIVGRIKTRYYDLWKKVVGWCGLVPSIGKNYLDRSFVVINSSMYDYHVDVMGLPCFSETPYINLGLMHPTNEVGRSGADTDHLSLDSNVWDLGTISHKLCKGFSLEQSERLMSHFMGDPYVKSKLKTVPHSISYFVSKALGGLGIKATRRDLLTKEQLGYYTRVATTRGELAPDFNDPCFKQGEAPFNIYTDVKGETVAEYWTLDQVEGNVTDRHLWDSFLKLLPKEAYGQHRIKGSTLIKDDAGVMPTLGASDEVRNAVLKSKISPQFFKSQRDIKSTYCDGIAIPMEQGSLFREHRNPWDQQTLCNFPWRRVRLTCREDPLIGLASLKEVESICHRPIFWGLSEVRKKVQAID